MPERGEGMSFSGDDLAFDLRLQLAKNCSRRHDAAKQNRWRVCRVEMDRQIRFDFYPIRYATTTKSRNVCCIPSEDCYQFRCLVNRGTMGVNSLSKTVTRQRRDCDLNPGRSAPESCTLIAKFHYTDTDPTRTGHGQSPRTLSGMS